MAPLTEEEGYFIEQHFKNPNITVRTIANKLNVDRGVIDIYLTVNYFKIKPYIKNRRTIRNAK